ncbi:reverse transcriptase/maturase family protein [Sedimentimonas flavescens]|uniref:Reverse transcriptase/maturase family protein n=1 Tax=Sedimentimonas flavescens TaxID=2851012 RepID=A0ABT2ZZ75_9RHOB|nr:reverse transcriptase/maturase family protein [Sedimentimonas flavescens]MCV2879064.1 reverse transcriptase/maturase family protein [Sedimentimonas flavescens]
MSLDWFKPRGYRHFDLPVSAKFASKVMNPDFVLQHSFVPLIHYTKSEKRYKKCPKTGARSISTKDRPIKYASHRDACILSFYASEMNKLLDAHYEAKGISDSVLAYRALGRGNYDFSAEVLEFAKTHAPVTILAFDVSSFFDNLDHILLKRRLKALLGVGSLPEDWMRVLRAITAFHFVDLDELKANSVFSARLKENGRNRIASVEELKVNGITFHPNPELVNGHRRGIPQGTPISAAASNLYMIDFDADARAYCESIGALYRRYSDDILVICQPDHAAAAMTKITDLIRAEKLEISPHKTEITEFAGSSAPVSGRSAQYLGFMLHETGPAIRQSSLARQWRKMRRAMRRTRKVAERNIASGKSKKAHTKRLYRRFTHLKVHDGESVRAVRNFSSYGRRSAAAFGDGEKITKQIKRFEHAALREIEKLKTL